MPGSLQANQDNWSLYVCLLHCHPCCGTALLWATHGLTVLRDHCYTAPLHGHPQAAPWRPLLPANTLHTDHYTDTGMQLRNLRLHDPSLGSFVPCRRTGLNIENQDPQYGETINLLSKIGQFWELKEVLYIITLRKNTYPDYSSQIWIHSYQA